VPVAATRVCAISHNPVSNWDETLALRCKQRDATVCNAAKEAQSNRVTTIADALPDN
jgi:hypothetical protein